MTKKEKLKLLFADLPAGRPVLFHPILMHFAARFNRRTYGEFASDHKILVECNIRALEHFDLDMVSLISDPYRETSAFGARIEYIPEGVPKCLDTLVKSINDAKLLKRPDVYKAERTLDRIRGAELYTKFLRGTVPVIGWIEGPLAEACDLAGVSGMLMYLMIDPDLSNYLMDKCVETAKDFARAQIEAGCDIIGMGDAICSQIDADTYDTYVKFRHVDIINFIHSLNARVKLHICGDITHLLPSLKDLNVDILDLDWKVDMDHAYNILGDKVVHCGNINPLEIQDKSEAEVYRMSLELIEREHNRRYILSGGCEITVHTPPLNLIAMRKASER